MKNRIIDVFKVVNRLLVITVENSDLKDLRVNQFVKLDIKIIGSAVFYDSFNSASVCLKSRYFTIDYTDDDLLDKEAVLLLIKKMGKE